MPETQFPCINFSQYGHASPADELLLFAAPARVLSAWAGIPRKAWHIRMLFQRPMTPRRESELKQFWEDASSNESKFILGPTAIVLAVQGTPKLTDGKIDLSFTPVVNIEDPPTKTVPELASKLYPVIRDRLSKDRQMLLEEFSAEPFAPEPDIQHDYVFEFALQLVQMKTDVEQFVQRNDIGLEQLTQIAVSMESLCRPAIVVDGQHRLWGAASAAREIILPVVAIPNCNWMDQIYQFVVINETAQKVETSILTDIFGSSLTKPEQAQVRQKLSRTRVDVEGRIAAVIASRDPNSPFYNMVQLRIEGSPGEAADAFMTERTIRVLIDGSGQKHSRGWRSDDEFYERFVSVTFPVREEWESWTDGKWQQYWLTFWTTVKDYYNDQAQKSKKTELWVSGRMTNLTKAVTLRQLQSLFMTKCIERMAEIDTTENILLETLGEEATREKIEQLRVQRALPSTLEGFRDFVQDFFLDKGVPVRAFTTEWKKSLDDAQGQAELWETLVTAFDRTKKGDARFTVRGGIFVASDD